MYVHAWNFIPEGSFVWESTHTWIGPRVWFQKSF